MLNIDFEQKIDLICNKDNMATLSDDNPNLLISLTNNINSSDLLNNILHNLFTKYSFARKPILFDYNESNKSSLILSEKTSRESTESLPDLLDYIEKDLKERKELLDELNCTSSFMCNIQLHRPFLPLQLVILFNFDMIINLPDGSILYNRFIEVLKHSKYMNYYFIFSLNSAQILDEIALKKYCQYIIIQ